MKMKKSKTRMGRIMGLSIVVFATVLALTQMAVAEDNFRVCVKAQTNSGINIDYVLYGEPNDAKDGVYDVNGTGSVTGMTSVPDIDFLVSGTASTSGGGISLSLNGNTIEGDNQYNLYFNTYMYEQGISTFGSFTAGLIVTDLTNTNPESRYKLQGTAQLVDCE
jgi:hypothetical protein